MLVETRSVGMAPTDSSSNGAPTSGKRVLFATEGGVPLSVRSHDEVTPEAQSRNTAIAGFESVSILSSVSPLPSQKDGEDNEVHIAVKLRVEPFENTPHQLSGHVKDALHAVSSLLKAKAIDSLVVRLPSFSASVEMDEAAILSRRKSRRLRYNQTASTSVGISTTESTWDAITQGVSDQSTNVATIGVSGSNLAEMENFITRTVARPGKPLNAVVVDVPSDLLPSGMLGTEAVEALGRSHGFDVRVSSDGCGSWLPEGLEESIRRMDSVSPTWVAKYTVFSTARSVVETSGFIVMAAIVP
ncbi:hypothetical protein BC830DRAFT_1079926 [Chytriomyces sp. MP71]|nr:hypothetical protein BC830DRAFT_1079926 [Chytriomyces sp. MP71]